MSKNIGSFDSSSGMSDASRVTLPGNKKNRVFYSAVVVDFIGNPEKDLASTEYPNFVEDESDEIQNYGDSLEKGYHSVGNPQLVRRMPRNSIVARIVSDKKGKSAPPLIFYPFFSPHLCMPVSAGEQVWIAYEEAGNAKSTGYWICRKPCEVYVDDLNYTHKDRETLDLGQSGSDTSAMASFEGSSGDEPDPFSFPKGGKKKKDDNTLAGEDPYEAIIENSLSYTNQFIGESVPRFSKRSTDVALQGSHNTLVVLGRDRSSTADSDSDGNTDVSGLSGTIDIVAGRGQEDSTAAVSSSTNSRDYEEIDKAPKVSGSGESNVNEGDPDFVNDSSRVYISMNTDGDSNFGIGDIDSIGDTDTEDSGQGPYAVVKSTNPRVIAREDGSVKIVHESGSSIVMDSSGNVQILTSGTITMGKDGQSVGIAAAGAVGANSFVRGEEITAWLGELATAIGTFATAVSTGGQTIGYGAPNPGLAAAGAALSAVVSASGDLAVHGSASDALSDIIKGE